MKALNPLTMKSLSRSNPATKTWSYRPLRISRAAMTMAETPEMQAFEISSGRGAVPK